MCTYNLSFNDSVIENARSVFPTQMAMTEWMQAQIESMLKKIAVKDTEDKPLRELSISDKIKALSNVPASTSHSDYKDEIADVLSEKY